MSTKKFVVACIASTDSKGITTYKSSRWHFCYAYKFGIITNGLGIVGDISFYDKNLLNTHPDIAIEKNRILQMKINA